MSEELLKEIIRLNEEILELKTQIKMMRPDPFKKLKGSKAIAEYCGFSQRTLFKKRKQLLAVGAIGYENSGFNMQMHMVAYPYLLLKYYQKMNKISKSTYSGRHKGKLSNAELQRLTTKNK